MGWGEGEKRAEGRKGMEGKWGKKGGRKEREGRGGKRGRSSEGEGGSSGSKPARQEHLREDLGLILALRSGTILRPPSHPVSP